MFEYSNSQICQDLFVISVLAGKRHGSYVEIGACSPVQGSNTWLLESRFGWSGLSFERAQERVDEFNALRKNICVRADATTMDFTNIARASGLGSHFDYLQLGVAPPQNTLQALKNIDLDRFRFAVVTYEHDLHAGGRAERIESRAILESFGYARVLSDAKNEDRAVADWWVRPDQMPNESWRSFIGEAISMDMKNMPASMRENILSLTMNLLDPAHDEQATRLSTRLRNILRRPPP